jgi:hypothetical protein
LANVDAAKAEKNVATASDAVHPKIDIVLATTMASEAVTVQSSITNVVVATATASEAATFHSAINADIVVAVASKTSSTAVSVFSSKAGIFYSVVPAAKADTASKANPEDYDEISVVGYREKWCREWIEINPSVVPKKFVIVAVPLYACTCQGCTSILAGVLYKVEWCFCDTFFDADPKCANMHLYDPPNPVTNYVELTSVKIIMTMKSLSVTGDTAVVVDSIHVITVSSQWTISELLGV